MTEPGRWPGWKSAAPGGSRSRIAAKIASLPEQRAPMEAMIEKIGPRQGAAPGRSSPTRRSGSSYKVARQELRPRTNVEGQRRLPDGDICFIH